MTFYYIDMKERSHLLDPAGLGGNLLLSPIGALVRAPKLQKHAEFIAEQDIPAPPLKLPPLKVVMYARQRPYPKSLACPPGTSEGVFYGIRRTLDGIQSQNYDNMQGVVVLIDEEWRPFAGEAMGLEDARLIPIPRDMTHPQALNLGVSEALKTDADDADGIDIVVITEADSCCATDQAFRAMAGAIGRGAIGVFGARLPDRRASILESLTIPSRHLKAGARFMAGYAADFLKSHPFDEAYARGGSDTLLAVEARAEFHWAASVQLAEHLGPFAVAAQSWEQHRQRKPHGYPIQPPISAPELNTLS